MRLLLLLAALASVAGCEREEQQSPPAVARPQVALLTSLPIVFPETFSLEAPRNPLLAALEERYRVVPVDGPGQLPAAGTLLAIQPQALTAERLVELDAWVREGGRLVLLADPWLAWESSRPLGDRFRPPVTYPDTGLLGHWGLTLRGDAGPGPDAVPLDLGRGITIETASGGELSSRIRGCRLSAGQVAARCRIGKGQVTVVADADFALDESRPGNQQAVVRLVEELHG